MTPAYDFALGAPGRLRPVRQGEDVVVHEGLLLLRVQGPAPAPVYVDDEPVSVTWSDDGRTAFGSLDWTNQVGYHRIEVRGSRVREAVDVRTSSAKATWNDVREMARTVAEQAFQFRQHFVYTSVTGERRVVRVPEAEYGWLRAHVDEVVSLCRDIDARPGVEAHHAVKSSRRADRVDVAATFRLWRENPKLLARGSGGPVDVEGTPYWPLAVRRQEVHRRPAQREHAAAAHLVTVLLNAVRELPRAEEPRLRLPPAALAALAEWQAKLVAAAGLPVLRPFRQGAAGRRHPGGPPSALERTDRRYGRLRAIREEFARNLLIDPDADSAVRTNLHEAWRVFQAYCAHMVGVALGLTYTERHGVLTRRDASGRSMSSAEFDLYYDVIPPRQVLRSWRADTAFPAEERPDIVIHERATGRVALFDVKYKRRVGHVEPDDFTELQGYLHSFGLARGGIFYPSSAHLLDYASDGRYRLVGAPVGADPIAARQQIEAALGAAWNDAPATFSNP